MPSSLHSQQLSLPSALNPLPLTVMPLTEWQLVTVTGADASQYLQGQLTCDVAHLAAEHYSYCAHCDAKGKVWSTLCLLPMPDGLAYLLRRSVAERQIQELKKYSLFAKVIIEQSTQWQLLAVAGEQAAALLQNHFTLLPDQNRTVIHENGSTILYFSQPQPRFLLLVTPEQKESLMTQLQQAGAVIQGDEQWLALEIAAGIPVIDDSSSHQFIPQALNLQALDGISFEKGCYVGQETVARAKYRGINKRALYWLSGSSHRLPQPGEELELQLSRDWRRTGQILAACQTAQGQLWVQAVLSHDLSAEDQLRVMGDSDSMLKIVPLPYPVNNE